MHRMQRSLLRRGINPSPPHAGEGLRYATVPFDPPTVGQACAFVEHVAEDCGIP
jgi:hypothetical protein